MIEDRRVATPHESSRKGATIRWIVLHADASPRESSTINWFQHKDAGASYHILVHRDGTSTRFVSDDRCAWHSGKSHWDGVNGVNRWSLGLSFANRNNGVEKLTVKQKATAKKWVRYWQSVYPIEAVLTHTMVAPTRKNDPEKAPNFRLEEFA